MTFQPFEVVDVASAVLLVLLVAVPLVLLEPRLQHWFVIPVAGCGVLIGVDGVRWLRARTDLLDPVGLVGLYGLHFFFLAPLLHVFWDNWMAYVDPPPDWRPWLGYMAWLNLVGLICYRGGLEVAGARLRCRSGGPMWRIELPRFKRAMVLALVLSVGAQVFVYAHFGGVGGFADAFAREKAPFRNMVYVFILSEAFPTIAIFGCAVSLRNRRINRYGWLVFGLLSTVMLSKILFGGLRGSRGMIIIVGFWAAGCLHLYVRPIPRLLVAWGLVFLAVFMYLYGFYKSGGTAGVAMAMKSETRDRLAESYGRGPKTVLLGDFGRADLQAFLLFRQATVRDMPYQWGSTYVAGLTVAHRRPVWQDWPTGKVEAGTDTLYGRGTYNPTRFKSFSQYGLGGEALVNFGPASVPLAFFVFGLVAGLIRTWLYALPVGDARRLLLPQVIVLACLMLMYDIDVLVVLLVTMGAVPAIVVAIGSLRTVVESHAA
jgi:hypothetical protein